MEASGDLRERAGEVAAALLRWYDANARDLPWRVPPGSADTPDPYRIWLSEIMLQQTTVGAVRPFFQRFTERWPTVEALAGEAEGEVLSAWAGLGYYARARNLIACARAVAARGGFPETEAELRALPGIGAYTAAAIAAIAFDRPAVAVDANVERVVARLVAVETALPAAKPLIQAAAARLVPTLRPGDFTQATMDLGSAICTRRTPACAACPLSAMCVARVRGIAADLPVKPAKKSRPRRSGTGFWIERDGEGGREVLLVSRPTKGMLGGMRALPDDGWSARADGSGAPPCDARWRRLETVIEHGFTHFTLELSVLTARAEAGADPLPTGEWHPVEKLSVAGLPTLFARAASLALDATGETA